MNLKINYILRNLSINKNNNDIINKIKCKITENVIKYLLTLDDNKLIINDKYEISRIELIDNENNKLYYNNNCQIINKKIYFLLNQIDNNLPIKTKLIKCVLNNKKIIIFYNDKIINVGNLNEDNIFIIEYIIYSDSSEDISQIYEVFKKRGYYAFIGRNISDKRIKINDNNQLLEAKIYSLYGEKETNKKRKVLSSKLKVLILLSLFKNKKEICQKANKKEKVFLMNKDWLFKYKYNEINNLIKKNEKLKDYLNKEETTNLSIYSIQMNNIISLLDYDSLLLIDESISKLQNINYIPCQAKMELLKSDNKNINIYTNFVMINEEIFNLLTKYFYFSNCEYNTYLSHMDGDIIIISKYSQNSILFGKINYMDYSFDIKYIFDFESNYKLENELKNLMDNEINEYIKNKTLLDEKVSNFISPIFDNDNIVGYTINIILIFIIQIITIFILKTKI